MRGGNFKNLGKNPPKPLKEQKPTLRRLAAYLTKAYKWKLSLVLGGIVLSSLAGVAGSVFLGVLIDDYLTPLLSQNNPQLAALIPPLVIMALIYLGGVGANLWSSWGMIQIGQGILQTIRQQMFGQMVYLPLAYFNSQSKGEIMSRYTNDTDALKQMLTQSIPQLFTSLITVGAVLITMFSLSWILSGVILLSTYLVFKLTQKIGKISRRCFRQQQDLLGQLNGQAEELIRGQKTIKILAQETQVSQQFTALNQKLAQENGRANSYANMVMPLVGNLGNLQYVLVAVVGGLLVIQQIGGLTLGAVVAFLQLNRLFVRPITKVSRQMNAILRALAGAERIFELLDQKLETDTGTVSLVKKSTWAWQTPQGLIPFQGNWQIKGLNFAYPGRNPLLQELSFRLPAGQITALVGKTGVGKTTLINLLNHFYSLQPGQIFLDGIDLSQIKKQDLRQVIGVIWQDNWFFKGTIRENIAYGRLGASEEEIRQAAKLAYADDFIRLLPEGYATIFQESNFSQGQKQLLSLARIILADTPMVILDEATSSVDQQTEALIQKALTDWFRGRTVLIIAHRLNTIQTANNILVLEAGEIVEQGQHEKL